MYVGLTNAENEKSSVDRSVLMGVKFPKGINIRGRLQRNGGRQPRRGQPIATASHTSKDKSQTPEALDKGERR
jgi:hypothetical protein